MGGENRAGQGRREAAYPKVRGRPNVMKGGLPRRETPRVLERRREAPGCCMSDWISAASVLIGRHSTVRERSRRWARCRLTATVWPSWPLACKTDRVDCWVLAELARRELVPEIWLPDPAVRAERERARFRLHLVKHRSSLKNRVHAILFQHGVPSPGSDLFGAGGRRLLERLQLPEPWASTLQ